MDDTLTKDEKDWEHNSDKKSTGTHLSNSSPTTTTTTTTTTLLSELCRICIVSNLERYPPDTFFIIDELEWESIVKLRHEKSKPTKGKGGLDGTGRLNPAIGEKFLSLVEETNPHLQQSKVVDHLVWKDIVEYRFKKGGLSRPKHLHAPWPVLVDQLDQAGKVLNACLLQQQGNQPATVQAIKYLEESPMDLNLLKDTRIGKTVKKFLSKTVGKFDFLDEPYVFSRGKDIRKTPRSTLQATLNRWMDMAAKNGVAMKFENQTSRTGESSSSKQQQQQQQQRKDTFVDLSAAKKCSSWRALYQTLKAQDEQRRSQQGEKMRERRQKLDLVRPKIVKVRHASAKHEKILNKASFGSGSDPPSNTRMQQLKMEARVTSIRRQPPVNSSPSASSYSSSNPRSTAFGAAVAYASTGKTVNGKRKMAPATKSIALAGGKRIKIPDIKKTASMDVKKRLEMLKKGQSSVRR
ncbi:TFIIS helical bundle-like domain containing protein [Nitzschia inconspicua]|uniref:TFIIS helical bundle-like domain containing protein n=1 Tax=Nitzschia inconspicua TaxID=303405 RepID=A0A9K3LW32_9STRA|nr:TFIIS helical bundle-like domain containing protein [Nitzschia inconspicua]